MSIETVLTKWNYPTEIHFGVNSSHLVIEHLQQAGLSKPLLISDKGLQEAGVVYAVVNKFKNKFDLVIYDEVPSDPTELTIEALLEVIKVNGCDSLVALGGGSVLDAAKAVSLLVKSGLKLWACEDGVLDTNQLCVTDILPVYALPTTAGTGSELGRVAVIKDTLLNRKRFIFHPDIVPAKVYYDAALTVSLPNSLTVATGVDAFVHAFEAYCVDSYHPIADALALESMKMIKDNLPLAVVQPDNLKARGELLVASGMAACAFQKGLGAVHALSHPLGAHYHKHHGLLNAILLPYVVKFNKEAIPEKLNRLCQHLCLSEISSECFINWLDDFLLKLEIPNTLSEINLMDIDIERISLEALQDPSASGNPIKLDKSNLKSILTAAC